MTVSVTDAFFVRRRDHEIYICNGRSRLRLGQGHHRGEPRQTAQKPRLQVRRPKTRPLHQHRPRDDEPLSARRGVRHRGRSRDRPRPGALRALHRRKPQQVLQPHDGQGLLERAEQGARGRISRADRAGHPAHHQRDQDVHPQRRREKRRGRRHHRDRRHDRRHREPAVHRGDTASVDGRGQKQLLFHPRHARAVYIRFVRIQVKAHAALGQGVAGHGHLPRHHRHALRHAASGRHQEQDRDVLQRRPRLRDRQRHRAAAL